MDSKDMDKSIVCGFLAHPVECTGCIEAILIEKTVLVTYILLISSYKLRTSLSLLLFFKFSTD